MILHNLSAALLLLAQAIGVKGKERSEQERCPGRQSESVQVSELQFSAASLGIAI